MKHRRAHRALRRRFGHAGAYVFEFEHDGRRVVIAHDAGARFLQFEARIYARRRIPERIPGRLSRVVATLMGATADAAEAKAKAAIDKAAIDNGALS